VLRTEKAVVSASMLVLFPLTFTSNVFVEPDTMPGPVEAFVGVNPVTHLVAAIRGLVHGTATAGQIGTVLVLSAAIVAVFGPITMYFYRRKQ
jgi:ABC-2 type transport system permease protein